jgi:hypothetical protein
LKNTAKRRRSKKNRLPEIKGFANRVDYACKNMESFRSLKSLLDFVLENIDDVRLSGDETSPDELSTFGT